MTFLLFIWSLNNGVLQLETKEPPVYYELKACQAAARKAENAALLFEGIATKARISAYCTPRKVSEQQ